MVYVRLLASQSPYAVFLGESEIAVLSLRVGSAVCVVPQRTDARTAICLQGGNVVNGLAGKCLPDFPEPLAATPPATNLPLPTRLSYCVFLLLRS